MFAGFPSLMTADVVPVVAVAGGISAQILATQAASLKGYWKLDETSGTSITDYSGNTNTLTLTGTPATDYNLNQSGETGASIQILGGAVFLAEKLSNILNADMQSQNFTMFALVKTSSATDQTITGFTAHGTFDRMIMQIKADGSALGYAEIGGVATYQANGGSVSNGAWHDLTFTRSGTAWAIYADGSSVGTDTGDFGVGARNIAGTNIGSNDDAFGPREILTGFVQHVAIWSVALSGAEITALHAAR